MFSFIGEVGAPARKALVAASLGWMLDSMDVMLYAMVVPALIADLEIDTAIAGLLASATLLSAAAGGVLFGVLADRIGRARALMWSVLLYSVFTAACGFATGVVDLAIYRVLLGLGMGGEWACGAALVAETWPSRHRGKALALVQSSWAIGYAVAAAVTAIVLPRFGWRAVFFVGILPALLTLWIRRAVPEPEIWISRRSGPLVQGELRGVFQRPLRRHALVASTMNAASLFAWWGLFNWIPSYLALPPDRGGAGLDIVQTSTWIILMQVGMWLGYVTYGFFADAIGRKRTYVAFLVVASALVPLYGSTRDATMLLVLGPFVAFFGTGYFSGFGVITAELFPTAIRASAQGLTYNVGRVVAAIAPFAVGWLAAVYGLGVAFLLTAAAFLTAALIALALPETKGVELT